MQERESHFDMVERSINRVMKFCYSEDRQKTPTPAELWMDIGIICGGFMRAREELAKHKQTRLMRQEGLFHRDLKQTLEILEEENGNTEDLEREAQSRTQAKKKERSKSPFTPIGEVGREGADSEN